MQFNIEEEIRKKEAREVKDKTDNIKLQSRDYLSNTVVNGVRDWICCKAADIFPGLPCKSWLSKQNKEEKE